MLVRWSQGGLIPRILFAFALFSLLIGVGCQKQPLRTAPAVLVPSIETEPHPSMEPQPPADESANAPQSAPASEPQTNQQKPKPKPRRPISHKPVQSAPTPVPAEAPKVEAPKPSQPDSSAQITADVPRAAVQTKRQNTENLLRNSESRLSSINRSLNDGEQGMLRQARNYIAQSNQALQAGDVERAYNLAVKASLLANELAK